MYIIGRKLHQTEFKKTKKLPGIHVMNLTKQ